jgi:hypothetical protein
MVRDTLSEKPTDLQKQTIVMILLALLLSFITSSEFVGSSPSLARCEILNVSDIWSEKEDRQSTTDGEISGFDCP